MTFMGAGDIELDYERSGAGPPLLLVMGMSGVGHLFFWEQPEHPAELVRAHASVPA